MWVLPINSNPTVLHPPMVDRVYIDRQIDELELYFCPDTGKCKKLTTEMRVRNEIYKIWIILLLLENHTLVSR